VEQILGCFNTAQINYRVQRTVEVPFVNGLTWQYTNTVKTQQIYYTLPLPGYMFRLLRVIIRPSNELTQDYLIPSALWDPVALTIVGAIVS